MANLDRTGRSCPAEHPTPVILLFDLIEDHCVCYRVDSSSRTLEIAIRAENKMGSSDITGVVVSFAIEGPVAADREGLIVWHPEKLPAMVCHALLCTAGSTDFSRRLQATDLSCR